MRQRLYRESGASHRCMIELLIGLFLASVLIPEPSLAVSPDRLRDIELEGPAAVVQRRYFTKRFRSEFGLLAGKLVNEAYMDTSFGGARASFYLSEWHGLEFQYLATSVVESQDRRALNQLRYRRADPEPGEEDLIVAPEPEVNPLRGMMDLGFIYAPFYGKLNLKDFLIIYADLYFTFGVSQVATDQGDKVALLISAGQRFYVSRNWSFRIDFRDRIFSEQRAGKDNLRHALSVDFGVSYFFGR